MMLLLKADTVTPGFIDSHSHIGMARSGELGREEEANEQMKTVYPLVNSLHSIYMDYPSSANQLRMALFIPQCYQAVEILLEERRLTFSKDIGDACVMDVGIKAALG